MSGSKYYDFMIHEFNVPTIFIWAFGMVNNVFMSPEGSLSYVFAPLDSLTATAVLNAVPCTVRRKIWYIMKLAESGSMARVHKFYACHLFTSINLSLVSNVHWLFVFAVGATLPLERRSRARSTSLLSR